MFLEVRPPKGLSANHLGKLAECHQPQHQPLQEEERATELCPGRSGKICHTFLHLEWPWLAYLYTSSFQQTWKILVLETSSWFFSYHSGLPWKAHFHGCSNFWSIVQFQSCWTIEEKSQGKPGSYSLGVPTGTFLPRDACKVLSAAPAPDNKSQVLRSSGSIY